MQLTMPHSSPPMAKKVKLQFHVFQDTSKIPSLKMLLYPPPTTYPTLSKKNYKNE